MAGVRANLSRLWRRPEPARAPLRPPRASRVGLPAVAVAGTGPDGEAVAVAGLGPREGGLVLLTFLTSHCHGCQQFWEDLRRPTPGGGRAVELPGTPRVAVVTPGAELEDRRKVAALAPDTVPVVMSARAWADYGVTGSPFAVVVRDGRVAGEAPLFCWEDLRSLLEHQAR